MAAALGDYPLFSYGGTGSIGAVALDFTAADPSWADREAAGELLLVDLGGSVVLQVVPEPSTLALLLVAGLWVALMRRRGRR